MKKYNIALLPGDGVGKEVIPEGVKVLQEVASVDGSFQLSTEQFPWGSDYYPKEIWQENNENMDNINITYLVVYT